MIRKIIKLIIVVLCMAIIFSFSTDTGTESNKKSDGVIISICKTFIKHDLSTKEKEKYINKYVKLVRKSAHFLIYLILGISIISLIKEYQIINSKALLIAITISFLYACSDEIHQLFVNGRTGKIIDVLIDTLGSIVGVYLYYYIYKFRRKKV